MEADTVARALYIMNFIIGGNIGIPLILLGIFFSKNVVRHSVFTNWCITWVIFSITYLFLLYTGQFNNLQPNFSLCLLQGTMIYSSDAMVGVSSFILIFYMDRVVHRGYISKGKEKVMFGTKVTIALLSAPYIVLLLVFFIVLAASLSRPETVHRSQLYCTIKLPIVHLGPGIAAALAIVGIILSTVTLVRLYRHWREQGKLTHIVPPGSKIDLSLILRIFLFVVIATVGVITAFVFISNVKSEAANIILSLFPIVIALTFGTTPDLLHAYVFWRRSLPREGNIGYSQSEHSQV